MEWTPQREPGASSCNNGYGRGGHRRHVAFGHFLGTGQIVGGAITAPSNHSQRNPSVPRPNNEWAGHDQHTHLIE
jgi:hypothetical protein